tara:strand:- start:1902 stop:2087 length:186 start_codon:yes stop_codon:yes gene_type:complete
VLATIEEGTGGFLADESTCDRVSYSGVNGPLAVLATRNNSKVLHSVIRLIPASVVDDLISL